MKTKLLKSTVSRVVNSAKNKAKKLKTLKPRVTSARAAVTKNTVNLNKIQGNESICEAYLKLIKKLLNCNLQQLLMQPSLVIELEDLLEIINLILDIFLLSLRYRLTMIDFGEVLVDDI